MGPKGQVCYLWFGRVFQWQWASGFHFLDLRTEICWCSVCGRAAGRGISICGPVVFEGVVLNAAPSDPCVLADYDSCAHNPSVFQYDYPLPTESEVIMEGERSCLWSCLFSHCSPFFSIRMEETGCPLQIIGLCSWLYFMEPKF